MDEFNNESSDVVTPEMIKPLASEKGAFPLCMKSMQCALTDSHHLKYKARLQYGLFLKGIGLSMEDAIRYFRGEFVRGPVDPEKFDKEYTYGIRYNYGKGMDTTPIFSCFTVSEVVLLQNHHFWNYTETMPPSGVASPISSKVSNGTTLTCSRFKH